MTHVASNERKRTRRLRQRRRGVAVVVVLGLIAVTLALSYAMMRSQVTAWQIGANGSRSADARQAAVAGLHVALRKMHRADWGGVGTTLVGNLSDYESYSVAFTSGDTSIAEGDTDYDMIPYRVTLRSTGVAVDPVDANLRSTHLIEAVVQLVPRQLGPQPSDWAAMQNFTVYQTHDDQAEIDFPARVEGPVRIQDRFKLPENYPTDGEITSTYFQHLNQMRLDGQPDYRPVTGPFHLDIGHQTGEQRDWLNDLGIDLVDTSRREAAADWQNTAPVDAYQIYPGGPIYEVPQLPPTLQDATLGPDPMANPLGIYYCQTDLEVYDHVTIQGSLLSNSEVCVYGTNVRFESFDMPAIYAADDSPVRLPVAACQQFKVMSGSQSEVEGLVIGFDRFVVRKSPSDTTFTLTGRVIAKLFDIKQREPYDTLDWPDYYAQFEASAATYFPVWLEGHGYGPRPNIVIKPDAAPANYHWNAADADVPVFVPHADDEGLRWDLIRWTDSP